MAKTSAATVSSASRIAVAPVRSRRDFAGLEQRRLRAGKMFAGGSTQAEVARALGVSRESASRWYAQWHAGGTKALRAAGRPGRPARLTQAQLRAVERALLKGARANSFPTELWTLARVQTVIEAVAGVTYHPGHVWKLLRAMGWSLQRPARRAAERNDDAINTWVATRWPTVKKTPADAGPGSSFKTSRGSRSPRRSGAPGRPAAARRS